MANFLDPQSVVEISHTLIERAEVELDEVYTAPLARLLARHIASDGAHLAPVRRPSGALPAWADGKTLWLPCPAPSLQEEVSLVLQVLSRVDLLLNQSALKTIDQTLHRQLRELSRALSHLTWSDLHARCAELEGAVELWIDAQWRTARSAKLDLGHQRKWRRLRSGQELWDATADSIWCVRRGDLRSADAVEAMMRRRSHFWVLEVRGEPRVLLEFDVAHNQILEVKDRSNRPPAGYRRAITTLANHLGVSLASCTCQDIVDLCISTDFDLRSGAHWSGDLDDPRAPGTLRFRLWADGRKRKYLLATTDSPKGATRHRISLDLSNRQHRLCGVAPESWPGSEAELMGRALALVAQRDGRIHWRRARRALQRLAA